jgi:hypothetical protein
MSLQMSLQMISIACWSSSSAAKLFDVYPAAHQARASEIVPRRTSGQEVITQGDDSGSWQLVVAVSSYFEPSLLYLLTGGEAAAAFVKSRD